MPHSSPGFSLGGGGAGPDAVGERHDVLGRPALQRRGGDARYLGRLGDRDLVVGDRGLEQLAPDCWTGDGVGGQAVLVLEHAVEHQEFLAAAMGVGREMAVRCIAHDRRGARDLLADPQTSGGLLVSCTPDSVKDVIAVFRAQGFDAAAPIGVVREGVGLRVVP